MNILVAGGAGYVGSHTCKALAAGGFRPVVYDNPATGHRGFVRWGPLVEVDLLDRETLASAFAEHRPAAVSKRCARSSSPRLTERMKSASRQRTG